MSTTTATPTRARKPMTAPHTAPAQAPVEPAAATASAETLAPAAGVRRPFGARRQRLENPPIPGFQCYWFNDIADRIGEAKEAGYEHVTDASGKPVCKVVGVMEGGGALKAYRMKLPIAFYQQDQEAKEAPRAEIDAAMRQAGQRDGGYASQGRPGFTTTPSAGAPAAYAQATMSTDGRQSFSGPKPQ